MICVINVLSKCLVRLAAVKNMQRGTNAENSSEVFDIARCQIDLQIRSKSIFLQLEVLRADDGSKFTHLTKVGPWGVTPLRFFAGSAALNELNTYYKL
jgi:hypothetical protein